MFKSLFYKIYFAVIAVFLVLLTIGLIMLGGWLKGYEAGRPENVIEGVIENYVKSGKIVEMRDELGLKLSPFETADNVKLFFEQSIKDKEITYASISKKGEEDLEGYGISAGGERLMNVYLAKSGDGYAVQSAELHKNFYQSAKVTMPADAEAFVNGIKISADSRQNLELPTLPTAYVGENIINKQFCVIENLINPEVKVTASEGFTVSQYDGGIFAVTKGDDATITDFATSAAKTYACYLQKDAGIGEVRSYLATDTEFYKNVSTSYITYVAKHVSYRFDDVEVSELHRYSDNLYSCRVKMTHVIISENGEEHSDFFDKYVYVYKNGGSMKAIDMQNFAGE